jgi:hypothetical protein
MRGHQPGSQPIDIPEVIPNPAIPRPTSPPSPSPNDPVKTPEPHSPEKEPAKLRVHAARVLMNAGAGDETDGLRSSLTRNTPTVHLDSAGSKGQGGGQSSGPFRGLRQRQ